MDQSMKKARNVIGGLGNLMFKQAYLIGQMLDGEIPDVYVQQYSRWSKYSNIIKATFMEGIKPGSIPKTSLHIRRGDYLKHTGVYVDLTKTDYYRKAVDYMDTTLEIDGERPLYLVFCKDNQGWEQDKSDRQWCREYLDTFMKGRYELVSKDNKEEDDLNLMASCWTHIGANSSFSWMAAFLGGGLTVMPREWFVEGAEAQAVEMLPEWKLI